MGTSHANLSQEAEAAAMRDAHADREILGDSQGIGVSVQFARLYSTAWLQAMCVYYGVAVFLHFVVPRLASPKRVQHGDLQSSSDTRRDAARALLPLAIRAGMLAFAEILHKTGHGVLTDEPLSSAMGTPWGVMCIVAMVFSLDLFHDTWFYFAHRLLHHRVLMKRVHYMHHQSKVPSAFSGYSFHWLEAIIMFVNAVVEIFIFPIPLALHRLYELWMIAIHVGGHCGFEMFPFIPHMGQLLWLLSGRRQEVRKMLNDVHHHDIHHRYPGYHFSLYFTHWDSLLGTIHPEWVRSVDTCKQE